MRKKRFLHLNEGFTCLHCSAKVPQHQHGSCRNHCNQCLYSMHLDVNPGDRSSECGSLMKPVFVDVTQVESIIHHECLQCGKIQRNKSSPDDSLEKILEILGQNSAIPDQ